MKPHSKQQAFNFHRKTMFSFLHNFVINHKLIIVASCESSTSNCPPPDRLIDHQMNLIFDGNSS